MASRRQFIFGVTCLALSHKATAITNASCKICKRWFIYSCEGAGYLRDKLNVTCGRCTFRDKFNDRFGPEDPLVDFMLNMAARVKEALMEANYQGDRYDLPAKLIRVAHLGSRFYGPIDESGMRYITFDDGKELDLFHVVATAPFGAMGYGGEIPILDFFKHTLLQAGANVAGFLNEVAQLGPHPDSAHPFGGNEDLYSNWVGSQIGANGILQNGHGDLGTQLTDYFESLGHGQIRGHQGQNPVDGLGGCG
jgi:hypothetical protein|tara:strand:- start:176 stop:928 length:753 start_codon:yes stop_codon:yes gene_type:complete